MQDVICPKCRSRFSAAAHADRSFARCGCGHVFRIPERTDSTAPVLHCDACAAPIREKAAACDHCGAPIMRKKMERERAALLCSGCRHVNPGSAQYCGACGMPMTPEAIREVPRSRKCPRCDGELQCRTIGEFMAIECRNCSGIWVAADEMKRIIDQAKTRCVKSAASVTLVTVPPAPKNHIRCLYCRRLMVTRQFSPRSRIYVDFCKPHGIWFDHLELQAAVRFVQRHPNAVMAWSARRTARPVEQRYFGARRAAEDEREFEQSSTVLRVLGILGRSL